MSLGFDFYGNLGLGTTQSSKSLFTDTNTSVNSTLVQSSLGYDPESTFTIEKNSFIEKIAEDIRNFFTIHFLNSNIDLLKNSFDNNISTVINDSIFINNILSSSEIELLKNSNYTVQEYFLLKTKEFQDKYTDDNDVYSFLIYDIMDIIQNSFFREYTIISLNDKINSLNTTIENIYKPKFASRSIVTEVKTDVVIDLKYIKYIEKYGVPENGIFNAIKLAEFI